MDTKKPTYVAGYVRNKLEKKPAADNSPIAVALAAMAVVSLAIVYWHITLTLAAVVVAGWYAKRKVISYRSEPALKINYYWRTRANDILRNLPRTIARIGLA